MTHTWSESVTEVAGGKVHFLTSGAGEPVLILHRDVGNPGWLPFYEQLAQHYAVYVPSHPGFDKSDRPEWMRNVRDLAVLYQWLLKEMKLPPLSIVGLGFGGWIAAEMATMDHHQLRKLVLVSAMGMKPTRGEILDQFLLYTTDYLRAGFHDPSHMDELYGKEPEVEQLVTWEINREMTTRIAWKPYMFNAAFPTLLKGVDTPTLIVWGKEDRIAPINCGERYMQALPHAELTTLNECGHFVEVEKANELAQLVIEFLKK
ncbi:MAG: alpha/beta hydrolase [Deltaproteobacteria bacterium]|nr:alpha/beta hydrolase [Deltaproteobacteria bacterium]